MAHLIIEIKARCNRPEQVREILLANRADFKGHDHQVDTYFRCPNGRLKLRQGEIESNLIHYYRDDQAGPKASHVRLCPTHSDSPWLDLLAEALGVLVTVGKRREIYSIDNVKFHIDTVEGLGGFVEIEAIDIDGTIGESALQKQCEHYMDLLAICSEDLVECSYSDMLLADGG